MACSTIKIAYAFLPNIQSVFEFEAEFGEIIVVLDEVFSEMHKFKFMGFRIESKKSLKLLAHVLDSISANIQPLMKQLEKIKVDAQSTKGMDQVNSGRLSAR